MSESRDTYNPLLRYLQVRFQEAVPLRDSDLNELQDLIQFRLRELTRKTETEGTLLETDGFHGFEICAHPSLDPNNFLIRDGYGIVDGTLQYNSADLYYKSQPGILALTPPGSGTRRDEVYLKIWVDEIGIAEDANIALVTPTGQIEASRRRKWKWEVHVAEGGTTPANDATYTYLQLAILTRTTSNQITAAMIDNTAFGEDTPQVPPNLELTSGVDYELIQPTQKAAMAAKQHVRPTTGWMKVAIGWKGTGVGTVNTLTDLSASFPVNGLTPYWLIDDAGTRFAISSNTVTAITVVGTPTSGDYIVSPDAAAYICGWKVKAAGAGRPGSCSIIQIPDVDIPSATTVQWEFHGLPLLQTYEVEVASVNGWDAGDRSAWCAKEEECIGWDLPVPVMTELVVKSANYGVEVSWPIPVNAHFFEGIWTEDGSIPDFAGKARAHEFTCVEGMYRIRASATKQIRVAVRAVNIAGRISANVSRGSATAGGTYIERHLNPYSFVVNLAANDDSEAKRRIAYFPLEVPATAIKLAVDVQAYTAGSGSTDGKIRLYRKDEEANAVSIVIDGTGYFTQIVDLSLDGACIMVLDGWDPSWDASPPSPNFPVIQGQATIIFEEPTPTVVAA